ncbi:MAG: SpoIIE family protein phosphatase [Sphingobacteriaceae bacterium]|nr:SpoIIE family protein phosphatase [Sphingobacteriaceae bacterium]
MVNCIYQDSKGFMWFGTQEGLNRYDGYKIKIYKHEPNKSNSLSYSEVNCLLELKNNTMLVGTPNGVNFLSLTNDSIYRLIFDTKDYNAKENHVTVIKQINETEVAIGTRNGIVICNINTKDFKYFPFSIDDEVLVKDIEVDNGRLLIATLKKGLWTLDLNGKKFGRVTFADEEKVSEGVLGLESINKLCLYGGNLYLATDGAGVYKVDPKTFLIEGQKKFKINYSDRNHIKDFLIKGGTVYCGTGSGFVTYNLLNGDTAIYVKSAENNNSLSDNKVTAVYIDRNENLWLGTFIGGVNVSFKSSQKFVNQFKYRLNSFKNLFLTFQDNQGNVWLCGDRKLSMLPKGQREFKSYDHVVGYFDALAVYQESNSIYWFGTYGDGLKRYDISTNKVTAFLSDKNGGTVLSILRVDDYLLVAAFGDGLFKIGLNSNTKTQYAEQDGLDNLNLTSLFLDKNNTIWILTDGGGIYNIENFSKTDGKFKLIKHHSNSTKESSIPSDVVYSMNQDNNGSLWFGTNSGLSRFDGKSFRNYYEGDGLANTFIYSILKDSTGRFWMSTNKGITAFNPTESNKPFFKNYNLKDGLTNTEHNIGAASSSALGNILFGGPNGYNIFRPSQVKDNLHVPPVYIVSYKRSGKDIPIDSNLIYKKHIKLSWRENYFQLEVVALDFIDPEKNLFKYKLEGYDNDWSEPSTVRYISYTELPGGTYTLKIKASNSDGVWNETPYELVITIVPPFWKTTWFYVVVVIVGTGLVVMFTQWRTRKIKEENKILEHKVAERTRELAEKNRDITSSIEYAKRIQEAILPSKDYIFSKLERAFILYKPKDIVSGDFYWFGEKNGWKIFAVVDCTGHGVPGAFMSMIGHNLMHQIIQEKGITDPGDILNSLHKGVQESLRQGNNEINTNDGMDVSIIALNNNKKTATWAGANRPLIIISNDGEFSKIDGNKYPIGGSQFDIKREFTTKTIELNKPSMAYLSSDGYADQFGGDNGKKFMVRRYHDLLMEIHLKDMDAQRELLNAAFEGWRKDHEQIDDVLVVGVAL